MRVWALYSTRVDPYHSWELVELFADGNVAHMTKDLLAGKQISPGWGDCWREDTQDPDFSDLQVVGIELR